jgi:signal transduction histidine kinase
MSEERAIRERGVGRAAGQLAAAAGLGNDALRAGPMEELFDRAVHMAAQGTGADVSIILQYTDGDRARFRAGRGVEGSEIAGDPTEGSFGHARTSSPVVVHDLVTERGSLASEFLRRKSLRCGIRAVIVSHGEPWGALDVYSRGPGHFDRNDLNFLQSIANTVSAALERGRANEELVLAEIDERRRITEDLHDDALQQLVATLLHIELSQVEGGGELTAAEVDDVVTSLRAVSAKLRTLLFDLHPDSLDRRGLATTITDVAQHIAKQAGWEVVIDGELDCVPTSAASAILFRVAREALANVRKHAGAASVRIELESLAGGTRIGIIDDGKGFDPQGHEATRVGHIGLTTMRRRVETANGWWDLASSPGKGTRVVFWIPGVEEREDEIGAGRRVPGE